MVNLCEIHWILDVLKQKQCFLSLFFSFCSTFKSLILSFFKTFCVNFILSHLFLLFLKWPHCGNLGHQIRSRRQRKRGMSGVKNQATNSAISLLFDGILSITSYQMNICFWLFLRIFSLSAMNFSTEHSVKWNIL